MARSHLSALLHLHLLFKLYYLHTPHLPQPEHLTHLLSYQLQPSYYLLVSLLVIVCCDVTLNALKGINK